VVDTPGPVSGRTVAGRSRQVAGLDQCCNRARGESFVSYKTFQKRKKADLFRIKQDLPAILKVKSSEKQRIYKFQLVEKVKRKPVRAKKSDLC
jgi:hypothetical protein